MKRFLLLVTSILLAGTALAEECSNEDFASFCETKAAVQRLLSYPAYTGWDEKVLNRAGDMAAIAVMKSISLEDLNSPEKARQVLLILQLAFAAPQLIGANSNRKPTAAMLLLDHLNKTGYDREHVNEIENPRLEIQHSTSTGRAYEFVTLEGAPPLDVCSLCPSREPTFRCVDFKQLPSSHSGLNVVGPTKYTCDPLRVFHDVVVRGCPGIKVDVEFVPVAHEQDGLTESPNDKIVKISKPYLDYSHMD
jgi:hypothetical protein